MGVPTRRFSVGLCQSLRGLLSLTTVFNILQSNFSHLINSNCRYLSCPGSQCKHVFKAPAVILAVCDNQLQYWHGYLLGTKNRKGVIGVDRNFGPMLSPRYNIMVM